MAGPRRPKARRTHDGRQARPDRQDRRDSPGPDGREDRDVRPVPHARPFPPDAVPRRPRGPFPPDPPDPPARPRPRPPKPRKILTRGDPARRLGITLLCIVFVLSLFAGRLVQLQGMESGHYRALANTNHDKTISLPALRGSITAADGSVLAMTVETYLVLADPPLIPVNQRQSVANQLAPLLGMPAAAILNLIEHPTSRDYVKLAADVSAPTDNQITALNLPGIASDPSYARSYPDGNIAANIVGFTSTVKGNLVGEAGLEASDNSLLSGKAGTEYTQINSNGQTIPLGDSGSPAVNGSNVKLTIYPALQYAAQQACEQEVAKARADNCSVVIMQPGTGYILAMAQWPTYNPSSITDITQTADIPLQSIFDPGSTAKVITAAAAFEHGGQTPMSPYNIPYSITRGGTVIHDAEWQPGERYTIAGIIAHSSNIGMSQVVQHVAPQTQYDYLRNFGLGQPTGLNLAEDPGILPVPSQWSADTRYTLSYGQGVSVNAVQMASVYATIANGGVRVNPTLVEGTTNANGGYTPAAPAKSRRVISAQTAHELTQILEQVPAFDAEGGQPWGIMNGYAIAAKTGTSQEWNGTCLCKFGASYIGMAPGDNPQLVVAVNVQNPRKGGYYGDIVAGPVFSQVMQTALTTLKIPPDGAKPAKIRLTAP
jgi:cell division protein FtsI (penicillin-binding protein 3)